MDETTPITLASAKYPSREAAVGAYKKIWEDRHEDEFDHMSVAVLSKDDGGKLRMDRHDSTTKHLLWGGVALGAALAVVAPPVGLAMLAGAGAVGGAGAVVGHFWHNIPKEKLREISDLLESGEAGLVIVAVNPKGTDINPLLAGAEKTIVVSTTAGNLQEEFDKELRASEANDTAKAADAAPAAG